MMTVVIHCCYNSTAAAPEDCRHSIYGYHIYNGMLISRYCNPAASANTGCERIWVAGQYYYIAKRCVPAGLEYLGEECAAMPV